MNKYETISISPKVKTIIERLANKHEMSQKDLTEAMAKYFDKTGVNPRDIKVLTVADELNKFRDTIISFMRKQEKDFILPTFGQMNAVIAKLMIYIEEEAPKRDGLSKPKSFELKPNFEEKKEESTVVALSKREVDLEELEKLKSEYQKLEEKHRDMKKYFKNILDKTSYKTTGLNKAPVIDLPLAEINNYKEFLKKHL